MLYVMPYVLDGHSFECGDDCGVDVEGFFFHEDLELDLLEAGFDF